LWESRNFGTLFGDHRVRLKKARDFAALVSRYYRVPVPALRGVRAGASKKTWTGQQLPNRLEVNIDVAGWTYPLLAHELAHYVLSRKVPNYEQHGALWMGVNLHILDKYKILGKHATLPSARAFKVKARHPDKCKPGNLSGN